MVAGVGSEDSTSDFYIPEESLVRHSDFAAAALRNDWRESQQRVIRLPEASPDLFEIFAIFVSSGKIHSSKANEVITIDELNSKDEEWVRLRDSWMLGDVLQSISFKDAITDAIIQKIQESERSPAGMQRTVYARTVQDNGLRRLLVDIAPFRWKKETFKTRCNANGALEDFYRDVCARLIEKQNGETDPLENAGCRYHDHGTEKPCYKTMF